ncbi:MAG: type II restriction endonuclease, partial [Caldisericum exile]
RGRDIKRYYYEWAGLWVIGTFPVLHLNIDDYPALKKYLLDHFDIRQLEQSGKKYPDLGFNARKKTGNKWFETQDQIAYYPEFEKEKVVYSEIVRQPQFYFDREKFYVEATSFLMTGKSVKYICGLLNSLPVTYFFKNWYAGGGLGEEGYRYKKAFLENLPLPPITSTNEPQVKRIESLVDKILAAKKQTPQADTSEWEREIDEIVYKLYDLTNEEIKIIEDKQ